MDALNDPAIAEIWFMKSAQVGWTEVLNNVVGFYVDQDPAPMLLIQPTVEMGEAWSKDRLAPMIRDSPRLTAKIADSKVKDSGNTILHKSFIGGHITIAGANSPAGLASRPVRVLLCDEVDRYPASAGSEGDPVSLARKRTTTFWNRKLLAGSTPTVKGKSRIEAGFLQGDQRRYFVPCPHCDHKQHLKWANVQWPEGKPEDAYYVCEGCGAVIVDADKPWMLAEADRRQRAGEKGIGWVATAEPKRAGIASFHINEIYSPWVTFGTMAANFIEAKQFPDTLRTWINTALGEPDDVRGESMDETGLLERREVYPAEVPAGVVLLTCGVDVQDNRLELEIVGWGPGGESWDIDYRVIEGDPGQHPSHSPLWKQLDDILTSDFEHELGVRVRISAAAIDTGGHKTEMVYAFCKPRFARRVFAVKGVGGHGRPLVSKPTRNNSAGVRLFSVGVDTAKELLFSRLKVNEPGPGFCHFPHTRDVAFFSQITAERLVTRYFKGTAVRRWELKDPKARNEALDCRVYATAALAILDVNLDKAAKKFRQRIEAMGVSREVLSAQEPSIERHDERPPPDSMPPARKAKVRPGGGFVNGWRR